MVVGNDNSYIHLIRRVVKIDRSEIHRLFCPFRYFNEFIPGFSISLDSLQLAYQLECFIFIFNIYMNSFILLDQIITVKLHSRF